jgi:hypothetical protein
VLPYKEALFERAWQRFQATGKDADCTRLVEMPLAGGFCLFGAQESVSGQSLERMAGGTQRPAPEAMQAIRKNA